MDTALPAPEGDDRRSAAPDAPPRPLEIPDGSRLGQWWRGRYGSHLLIEIAICGGLLVIYRTIRMFTKGDLTAAFANTRDIIRLER